MIYKIRYKYSDRTGINYRTAIIELPDGISETDASKAFETHCNLKFAKHGARFIKTIWINKVITEKISLENEAVK